MGFAQKLQRNPLLFLAVGAALIAAAAILIWTNIAARSATAQSAAKSETSVAALQSSTQKILVAARAIPRGAVVTSDDVMPYGVAGPAPSGSFDEPSAVIGRVATIDILPSQIILGDALSATKQAAGVAALVQSGIRAFSVRIAEDQIVGGFLRVNDRVDVFATLPDSVFPQTMDGGHKAADQSRTTLLLQNIEVLAVGEKLETKGADALNGARTVTLAVAPDEAARIALADRLGKMTLAIRNPADKNIAPETTVSLSDLGATSTETTARSTTPTKAVVSSGRKIILYSGAATTTVTTPR